MKDISQKIEKLTEGLVGRIGVAAQEIGGDEVIAINGDETFAMASGDMILGVHQFFQMFIVALTILAGIFIGLVIIRPQPSL